MSITRVIYEIKTSQGVAKLIQRFRANRSSTDVPVLFVHGFGSSADVWYAYPDSLGNYFEKKELNCWSLQLSNTTTGNIQLLANEDLYTAITFIYDQVKQPILVIAHSMGGIIARVLTSPQFEHNFPLATLEPKIKGIVLLTVPNHGVEGGDVRKIEETVLQLKDYLKLDTKISPDFGLGFFQLISTSTLLERLNSEPVLNPNITWLNAVGKFDNVVPIQSATFKLSEVKIPKFEQKGFACDHMVYPFSSTLQKITDKLDDIATIFGSSLKLYPAIHRSKEVGNWILDIFGRT
jgi:pimeloyl-ACP methyl ester carboxylesterase